MGVMWKLIFQTAGLRAGRFRIFGVSVTSVAF